jgi:hypothetical protein
LVLLSACADGTSDGTGTIQNPQMVAGMGAQPPGPGGNAGMSSTPPPQAMAGRTGSNPGNSAGAPGNPDPGPMAGRGGAGMSGGSSGTTGGAGSGGSNGTAGMTGAAGGPGPGGSCLDGITGLTEEGKFDYMPATEGRIKYWVPMVPAGCKVPVVHLANGTGATCSAYQRTLNRLASHGFLAACYEDTNTGAGTQGVEALETAFMKWPDLADKRIGSTGHSQGGQAAFTVLQQAEAKFGDSYVYAGLAMQPASGFGDQPAGGWQPMYAKIKSPMFMFSGTADILVSRGWVSSGFRALDDGIEAYHWSGAGSTHIPTPDAETAEIAVPWFRWKLLGDNEACKVFKALDGAGFWSTVEEQNPKSCM